MNEGGPLWKNPDVVLNLNGHRIVIPALLDPVRQALLGDLDEVDAINPLFTEERESDCVAIAAPNTAAKRPGSVSGGVTRRMGEHRSQAHPGPGDRHSNKRAPTTNDANPKAALGSGSVPPDVTAPGQSQPNENNHVTDVAADRDGTNASHSHPAPHTVPALADLLEEVVSSVRSYVYLRGEMKYAEAITLWIAGTHAFVWSNTFPRFVATSPEPNCGKSTLLKVMEALCPNSSYHAQATEAAIVRRISRAREILGVTPTMFLDDAENFINEKHTNFLNSGFDRFGGTLLRCRVSKGNFVDEEFDVYVPVAIGRIGTTPVDSTRTRCLEVNVQRARPGDQYLRLNADGRAKLFALAEQLAARIDLDGASLENYDPKLPAALTNRDADLWRFLIAVADLAGGHWPQTARDSASAITLRASSRSSSEELCLALQAALDLARNPRALVEAKLSLQELGIHEVASGNFRIPSIALCQLLSKVSAKLNSVDERSLANKLRPFDIGPASIRGSKPAKGYKEEDLRDLLDRYRPVEHPDG